MLLTPDFSAEYHAIGHAHGLLEKAGGTPTKAFVLTGRLYLSKSGYLLLSVPNALGRGAFDALDESGAELPSGPDGSPYNAHLTVMLPWEIEQIGGAEKISERGHEQAYCLGPVVEIEPAGWKDVSRCWAIQVESTDLKNLRKSYGLTPLPNGDHEFHITFGIRRKKILQNNDIAKVAALISEEEIRPWGKVYCETCLEGFYGLGDNRLGGLDKCPDCSGDVVPFKALPAKSRGKVFAELREKRSKQDRPVPDDGNDPADREDCPHCHAMHERGDGYCNNCGGRWPAVTKSAADAMLPYRAAAVAAGVGTSMNPWAAVSHAGGVPAAWPNLIDDPRSRLLQLLHNESRRLPEVFDPVGRDHELLVSGERGSVRFNPGEWLDLKAELHPAATPPAAPAASQASADAASFGDWVSRNKTPLLAGAGLAAAAGLGGYGLYNLLLDDEPDGVKTAAERLVELISSDPASDLLALLEKAAGPLPPAPKNPVLGLLGAGLKKLPAAVAAPVKATSNVISKGFTQPRGFPYPATERVFSPSQTAFTATLGGGAAGLAEYGRRRWNNAAMLLDPAVTPSGPSVSSSGWNHSQLQQTTPAWNEFVNKQVNPPGSAPAIDANRPAEQGLYNFLRTQPADAVNRFAVRMRFSDPRDGFLKRLTDSYWNRPLLSESEFASDPTAWEMFREQQRGQGHPVTNRQPSSSVANRPGRPLTIRPDVPAPAGVVAAHEMSHVRQGLTSGMLQPEERKNEWAELTPTLGDVPNLEELTRRKQKDFGRPVEGSRLGVNFPGAAHAASWMRDRAAEHGFFGGRSMAELLNTNAGRSWFQTAAGIRPGLGPDDPYYPPTYYIPSSPPDDQGASFRRDMEKALREAGVGQ